MFILLPIQSFSTLSVLGFSYTYQFWNDKSTTFVCTRPLLSFVILPIHWIGWQFASNTPLLLLICKHMDIVIILQLLPLHAIMWAFIWYVRSSCTVCLILVSYERWNEKKTEAQNQNFWFVFLSVCLTELLEHFTTQYFAILLFKSESIVSHFAVVITELLPYLKCRWPFSTYPIPT